MGRAVNSFTAWVGQANLHGSRVLLPEEKLCAAILSQAAHDVVSPHVGRLERDAAKAFFINKSERFRIICEMAGREPQYVHERMKRKILKANGWNMDISMHTPHQRSSTRRKRGPKKKHLTGNAYYAAKTIKHFMKGR